MSNRKDDLRSIIEQIQVRLPLSEVIRATVHLSKKGREYQGLCPFHKEKTPSFYVNDEKGFYHCFGCGAHGDHFTFLEKMQRLSFKEALEQLAQKCGVSLPETFAMSEKDTQTAKISLQPLYDCLDQAARFYYRSLQNTTDERLRKYLSQRSITVEDIRYFGLGYAPRGDEIIHYLQDKGFSVQRMIEAGLLIAPDDQNRPYPRFRDRLIFPLWDIKNRIMAFGGRTLGDDQPKYLNSPETPVFHKGKTLYGLHWALKATPRAPQCIVCEGYFDVIQLHKQGFVESVAPLGTALTEEQLLILWRYWKEIVLCFDGDQAGLTAALRAIERALPFVEPSRNLKVLLLPAQEDPDSYLQKFGKQAFQEKLQEALPLSHFLFEQTTRKHNLSTPEGLSGLKKDLKDMAHKIQDTTTRQAYEQFFFAQLPKAQYTSKTTKKATTYSIPPVLVNRKQILEGCLLQSLILAPSLIAKVADDLFQLEFENPDLLEIRDVFLANHEQHPHPETWKEQTLISLSEKQHKILNDSQFAIHLLTFTRDHPLSFLETLWKELFSNYQQVKNLEADLKKAYEELHAHMTPAAWEKVKTLQNMVLALRQEFSVE